MTKIEKFLKALRDSDFFIEHIYMNGGCYQLYKVIKSVFPDAEPYFSKELVHIAAMVDGKLYDIRGPIDEKTVGGFVLMTPEQCQEAESWSFAENNDLYYGECPVCEEPIRIDRKKLMSRVKQC